MLGAIDEEKRCKGIGEKPTVGNVGGKCQSVILQHSYTMSRPLDNVNPTIFAPATASSSRRPRSEKALLWDGVDRELLGEYGSEEEREEIDAQEVYGGSSP